MAGGHDAAAAPETAAAATSAAAEKGPLNAELRAAKETGWTEGRQDGRLEVWREVATLIGEEKLAKVAGTEEILAPLIKARLEDLKPAASAQAGEAKPADVKAGEGGKPGDASTPATPSLLERAKASLTNYLNS